MKNIVTRTRTALTWFIGALATLLFMAVPALGQYTTNSSGGITIRDNANGDPYPSVVTTTNVLGSVERVAVTLNGFTHPYPPDVDILLVGPNSASVVLMSDVGNGGASSAVANLQLTISDQAAGAFPVSAKLTSGSYQPTDNEPNNNEFNPPILGPYGSSLNAAFAGINPNGEWKLYVRDDSIPDAGSISSWTLLLYTTPLVSLSTNTLVTAEDTTGTVLVTVKDSSPDATLTVSGVANNPSLISDTNITSSPASGEVRILSITPNKDQTGNTTVVVTVSDGIGSVTTNLVVEVTPVNDAPTVTLATNAVTTIAGAVTANITVTVADIDSDPATVTLYATSDNPTVVSSNSVFFSGTGVNRTMNVAPVGAATGIANLNIFATDGTNASSGAPLKVQVDAAPYYVVGNPAAVVVPTGSTLATPYPSELVVTNVNGPIGAVTVVLATMNVTNVPNLGVMLAHENGPGGTTNAVVLMREAGDGNLTNIRLTFSDEEPAMGLDVITANSTNGVADYGLGVFPAPAPGLPYQGSLDAAFADNNANGKWWLYVYNAAAGTTSRIDGGFVLNLYTAPYVASGLTNMAIAEGSGAYKPVISVADKDGQILSMTTTSGDPALFTVANNFAGPTNATQVELVITPVTGDVYGTNNLTVVLTDNNGFKSTNVVTVAITSVNDIPTISAIPRQNTRAGVPTGLIPFTVGDVETAAASLTVTAVSSQPTVLPSENIQITGTGANRNVQLFPIGTRAGTAEVTLTVSDGTATSSTSFTFNVLEAAASIFQNTTRLDLNDSAVPPTASLYPSTIVVSSLSGTVAEVQASLYGVTWANLADLDVLLVGPGTTPASVLLMSDAGGSANAATYVFADSAGGLMAASGSILSGIYKPSDYAPADSFPAPAPGSGYGTTLSVFNGASPNGTWSLYVMDDTVNNDRGTVIANGWSLSIATSPTLAAIPAQTTQEDQSLRVQVNMGTPQAGFTYAVTATSGNQTIIPNGNIKVNAFGGASVQELEIQPATNQFGTNIVITVTGTMTAPGVTGSPFIVTTNFTVTVVAVDDPVYLTQIPNQTAPKGQIIGPITFTATDAEGTTVVLAADSSNPALIPNGNIQLVSAGAASTVTMVPVGIQTGRASITVSATDNNGTGQKTTMTFEVQVVDALAFENASPITINDNGQANPYPSLIRVSGVGGLLNGLEVTLVGFSHAYPDDVDILLVGPNNKNVILMSDAGGGTPGISGARLSFSQTAAGLVPDNAIASGVYQPTDYEPSVTEFAPIVGPYGNNLLTAFAGISPNGDWNLYVRDDTFTVSGSIDNGWLLTLHTAPEITAIPNQTMAEDTTLVLPLTISDSDTIATNLTVTAVPSAQAPANLVNATNLIVAYNNGGWTLTIKPTQDLYGTNLITVNVTDGMTPTSTSFGLTVTPVNDAPVIVASTNSVTTAEDIVANVQFTVSDVDQPAQFTTNNVSVLSLNTVLVSTTNLVVTSPSSNVFNVQITPNLNEYGNGMFQFSVSDGTNSATTNISLVVTPVNDVPIITGLTNTSVRLGESTPPMPFTVSDVETPAKNLVVTASSGNTAIVPDANIVLGGSGSTRTIQITPVGSTTGVVTIAVKVDDGTTNSIASFDLSVVNALGAYFANTTPITINDTNTATPYPSAIGVAGLVGPVFNVAVTLEGFAHSAPDDVDVLLVSPANKAVMLMSDAGGATPVSGLRLRFVDGSPALPDETPLTSGTYAPTDYQPGDTMPAPAPAGPYSTSLSSIAGTTANGTWSLYVSDDTLNGTGSISQGWALDIVTSPKVDIIVPGAPGLTLTVPEDTVAVNVVNISGAATNQVAFGVESSNRTLQPTGADNVSLVLVDLNLNQWQIRLTPAVDQTGTNQVTLKVTNTANGSWTSVIFTNVFTAVNDAPVISRLLPVTTPENKAATISFVVTDVDTPVTALDIQATSGNPSVIASTSLKFFGNTNYLASIPASTVELTMTPVANAFGSATITILVRDTNDTAVNATSSFVLTVTDVNSPPTITMATNKVVTQAGVTSAPVNFTVADPEGASMTVTATSSRPELLKNASIVITPVSGTTSARVVVATPESAVEGTATVTLTVTDGASNASATYDVVVTASRERSFANTNLITITDNSPATPYPSEITIAPGTLQGSIAKLTATLNGFTHRYPQDVDILLVAPSAATNVMLMSDAGGGTPVTGLTLQFSESAATPVPQASLASGSYQPANYDINTDQFPAPAPAGPYGTNLNAFNTLSPNGTWALYVRDDTATDGGAISNGWSLSITTQPVIQGLTNVTTPEDVAVRESFVILEESFASTNFKITGTSSQQAVVANSGITFQAGATPYDWTVTVQPVTNSFGASTITVAVENASGQIVTKAFIVTVESVNDVPTVTQIPNQRINAGTVAGPITFDYSDPETPTKDLVVIKASSNEALIPTNNITIRGNQLWIAPVGAMTGVSTITIRVTDTVGASGQTQFDVDVVPSPTPLFANAAAIVINDNAPATPYPSSIEVTNVVGMVSQVVVTLAQVNHPYPADLDILLVGQGTNTVVLMSDAGGAVPLVNTRIAFSDTAVNSLPENSAVTNGTYKPSNYAGSDTFAAPAPAGPYGSQLSVFNGKDPNGTWSLYVMDDSAPDAGSISGGWLLNIITTSPTISSIPNQTTPEDVPLTVQFTVSDSDTAISNLVVTANIAEGQEAIVSVPQTPLTSTTGNYSLTITPLENASGTNTIVVTANDGTTETTTEFVVVVTPVNDAPVIVGLTDAETPANVPVTQEFVVSDVETPASELTVVASSSNLGLGTLSLAGTNGVYVLEFVPIGVQGNTAIAVVASDGQLSTTNSILITVIAPRTPVIAPIPDQTMLEDTQLPVGVTITGTTTTDLQSVTASWGDTNVLQTVQILGSGLSRVALITPQPDAFGTSTVTIVATDIYASVTNMFMVTVIAVNDPPMLAPIPAQTTTENVPAVVPIVVTDVDTPLTNMLFGASNYNSNIVAGVTFDVTSSNVLATVNLVPNASGVTAVTISVTDGTTASSTVFALQVIDVPMSIAPIDNQVVPEDSTLTVAITIVGTGSTNVVVTADASDTNVVQSVVVMGAGESWAATIALVPNATGVSTITVTATDGGDTTSTSFTVTVTPIDDVPILGTIDDVVTGENMQATVEIPVSDPDTALTNLVFGYETSDTNLVAAVNFSVTETNVTGTVVPVLNAIGTATITISAASGTNVAYSSFEFTTTNLPPSISTIQNISVLEDSPPVVASFTVINTSSTNVTVTASAMNTNLVQSIVISGGPEAYNATITLVPNASGLSIITITATEPEEGSGSSSFALTVAPVDDAPQLQPIPDQTTTENVPVVIPLVVTDMDTESAALTYGYSTSNTNLVSNVIFTVTESNVVATVELVANAVGVATVTIDVSDTMATASESFQLTVTPQGGGEAQLTVSLNGTTLAIGVSGTPDTTYTMQGTSDFIIWADVGTVTTDASGKGVYTADTTASKYLYYRTKSQ